MYSLAQNRRAPPVAKAFVKPHELIYNRRPCRFRSPASVGWLAHPSGSGGKDPIRDILTCGQGTGAAMSDWIHNLPVPLMALAIFAFTYLLAIIIFAAVSTLATGERAKSFQAISPGMLRYWVSYSVCLLLSPPRRSGKRQ